MLHGPLARQGYDWWWHSFTAQDAETGEDKPFFIEFFLCNPDLGEDEPVFGQLPENRAAGKKPSYLMVKAGTWGEDHCQLHRFFAWKDVTVDEEAPYRVEAGECLATEDRLKGVIRITPEEAAAHPEWMCDSGELSWNLTIDKKIAFNVGYGAGKLFRDLNAFAMYWHAEGMKTTYSGKIRYNGRVYLVSPENSYGYADKNWGKDFTSPWVWLSSNSLVSKSTGKRLQNSVFDIGGGRPEVFSVALDRRLLGVFYYEGEEFDFNFSHTHLHVKTDFSFEEQEDTVVWHVRQESISAVMETEIFCKKKDMIFVNYEAPDGSKKHNRLWNGGNGWGTVKLYRKKNEWRSPELVDEIEADHVGCEYGEYGPSAEEDEEKILEAEKQLNEWAEELKKRAEAEEPLLKDKLEAFYTSPESRDSERCTAFRKELKESFLRDAKVSEKDYYALKSELLKDVRLAKGRYSKIGQDAYWSVLKQKSLTDRLAEDAVRKAWKPVHVLTGTFGAYNKCICYDEEMKVFFRLSPDDNYYHWGGYDLFAISEEEAKETLGKECPWHEDPEARSKYTAFSDSDPEIRGRIRR